MRRRCDRARRRGPNRLRTFALSSEMRVSGPQFACCSGARRCRRCRLRKDCQTTVTLPAASATARALKSLKGARGEAFRLGILPPFGIVAANRS